MLLMISISCAIWVGGKNSSGPFGALSVKGGSYSCAIRTSLAAAFLEAGFRHIAVQNTRNPVQSMNDVAAATLAHRCLVGQLVDHPKVLGFRPI